MLRRINLNSSWRVVVTGVALVAWACFAWPSYSYGRSHAHVGSTPQGASHLYVLLGLGNNSPGLSEFGSKIGRRGIPTTVRNHGDWPSLAQDAIQQYKSGRLRSIMIVGHSLGGGAAMAMAAEIGRAGVPVDLVATLDPVGGSEVSSNVRRSVNFRPNNGEDHFSVIAAHDRDLSSLVLGGMRSRGSRVVARRRVVRMSYSIRGRLRSRAYYWRR
jgi:pimeloyl-ACP methyl ester carboxylesterase